jgi:hypothetical protein
MKLLAMIGSLILLVWIVGMLLLTFHNVSKTLFGHVFENEPGVRFFMRQILIILWPLVLASEEGRYALRVIWTGRDDWTPPGRPDLAPTLEGDTFTTRGNVPRSSNRRVD